MPIREKARENSKQNFRNCVSEGLKVQKNDDDRDRISHIFHWSSSIINHSLIARVTASTRSLGVLLF